MPYSRYSTYTMTIRVLVGGNPAVVTGNPTTFLKLLTEPLRYGLTPRVNYTTWTGTNNATKQSYMQDNSLAEAKFNFGL